MLRLKGCPVGSWLSLLIKVQQIVQYRKLSVTMDMASDENGDHLTALADAGSNYMSYGVLIILFEKIHS